MADKPSRALVLYGDGLARGLDTSSRNGHLNTLASLSCCGFLSLPNAPPNEGEDERIAREFAVLLDSYDLNGIESSVIASLSERFMGMKTALVTNHSGLESLCHKLSITTFHIDQLVAAGSSCAVVTCELLKLLGFEGEGASETSQFDLVFFHVGVGKGDKDMATSIEYMHGLVGSILQIAPSGSAIGSRLHLSVAMSYGRVLEDDSIRYPIEMSKNEMDPRLSAIVPRQSYTMRGETPRENVRHHCPILLAQFQDGVTRVDLAKAFSFLEFTQKGGILVIPADRFVHEVAFKLWKAPKYGA